MGPEFNPVMIRFTQDIDRIRVRPRSERSAGVAVRLCCWEGCAAPAPHRAPKAPDRLREYHWFCAQHAREYNHGWNFFAGKSALEVEDYIRDNLTGHRPTWRHRDAGLGRSSGQPASGWSHSYQDRFNLFGDPAEPAAASQPHAVAGRRLPAAVAEAYVSLGLEQTATLKEAKLRYKELVKRFHPDANGGNRATEGQLKQVIQAFNRLRASGIK